MKQKTFEYNLENKIIPIAQNILTSSKIHAPTIFTYDSDGVERIAELVKLFSYEDKELIYGIISKYKKDKVIKEKQDCLVFQYQYKNNYGDKRVALSGTISYEYEKIEDNIIIDYHNPNVFKDGVDKSKSRLDNIF